MFTHQQSLNDEMTFDAQDILPKKIERDAKSVGHWHTQLDNHFRHKAALAVTEQDCQAVVPHGVAGRLVHVRSCQEDQDSREE